MSSSLTVDNTKSLSSPIAQTRRPSNAAQLTFAKRKEAQREEKVTSLQSLMNDGHWVSSRSVSRPLPVDPTRESTKVKSQPTPAQSRSRYFEDAFQAGREVSLAKDRIRSEAVIMAEVCTNVIRPVSSIVVTLQHGACMLFGGSFDSAYTMSISGLPIEFAPTKNRRIAALLQKYMEESLGVLPRRGYLRFVPLPEENVAWDGKTVASELAETQGLEDEHGVATILQHKTSRRLSAKVKESRVRSAPASLTRQSMSSLKSRSTKTNSAPDRIDLIASHSMDSGPPMPLMATVCEGGESRAGGMTSNADKDDCKGEELWKSPKVGKRKSFVASFFGRSKLGV
ncbi:MIF domain-containing protein [Verticillium alfalfae VaMs.102]|uniref:L-dopachrome isomerase n=1 Tax=Verticillium alfalfae (strain VaMs.102 / ATCC MYA-4576 / FGSC 10136) TaxID=526221 RepID=C9SUY2_VERA1|nr:MIF domain-containing protein [Verticillium alfalfae VaMs.102]EEY22597.1 MIF domain-containing protein [Verticillium alfalfae VaMs.102]